MNDMSRVGRQAGYTLIELLLYVTILGSLLTAISLYFSTSTESRVKNQSIAEVNQNGTLIMERITHAIRNADSITSPTAGNNAASLTIVTSGVNTVFNMDGGSTQIMGYNGTGTATDGANSNVVNATKFTAPASGNITTVYARIASPISPNPNNRARMAIYSGASNPSTLLGSSSEVTLTGNAWNTFTLTASVGVTSGTTYWLAYNTNGNSASDNNLRRQAGTTNQSQWINQTYGTWPGSFNANSQDFEFSMYADIVVSGGGTVIRSTEGAGSAIPLSSTKVQISGLTFTNLTRSGTPGVMRVSFTVTRLNPGNRNAYNYSKTFTSSASLR